MYRTQWRHATGRLVWHAEWCASRACRWVLYRLWRLLQQIPILLACVALLCPAPALAGVTPWVDFEIKNNRILIKTEVGGIPGYSMIDTGAQISGISEKFLATHKLKLTPAGTIQIKGIAGTATRPMFRNTMVKLMDAEINFRRLTSLNFGGDIQLLIGGDFLANLYFQFDYPNQRLRGITRDTFDLKKIKNVESKLDKVTRQPIVKVRLNDEKSVWLVMDTGSAGGVFLKRGIATKGNWLEEYGAQSITSTGVVTTAQSEMFRLPVLSIGPYDVRNARVIVPAKGERLEIFKRFKTMSSARSKIQGLLGYDVLKNFLVTIDYRSGALFVEIPEVHASRDSGSQDAQ